MLDRLHLVYSLKLQDLDTRSAIKSVTNS